MKHVFIGLLEGGLYLFIDDVHYGIVSVIDNEVHIGVAAAFVLLRGALKGVLEGF